MTKKPIDAPAGYSGDPLKRPTSPPPPRKRTSVRSEMAAFAAMREMAETITEMVDAFKVIMANASGLTMSDFTDEDVAAFIHNTLHPEQD